MTELQQTVRTAQDRLEREVDHLLHQLDEIPPDAETVQLVTQQAKRVRRESNLLVRALAALRDNLQPGGTR